MRRGERCDSAASASRSAAGLLWYAGIEFIARVYRRQSYRIYRVNVLAIMSL